MAATVDWATARSVAARVVKDDGFASTYRAESLRADMAELTPTGRTARRAGDRLGQSERFGESQGRRSGGMGRGEPRQFRSAHAPLAGQARQTQARPPGCRALLGRPAAESAREGPLRRSRAGRSQDDRRRTGCTSRLDEWQGDRAVRPPRSSKTNVPRTRIGSTTSAPTCSHSNNGTDSRPRSSVSGWPSTSAPTGRNSPLSPGCDHTSSAW